MCRDTDGAGKTEYEKKMQQKMMEKVTVEF